MSTLQIKAAVRERDGFRCVDCGLSNEAHLSRHGQQLHVHRKVPGSFYSLEGCETLCFACHKRKPRRQPGDIDHDSPPIQFRLGDQTLAEMDYLVQAITEETGKRHTRSSVLRLLIRQGHERLGRRRKKSQKKSIVPLTRRVNGGRKKMSNQPPLTRREP